MGLTTTQVEPTFCCYITNDGRLICIRTLDAAAVKNQCRGNHIQLKLKPSCLHKLHYPIFVKDAFIHVD